ncbi:hypothetical protein TRIXIE_80 [Mycobacterium phage Trixie]|uniref:Uncharacterized protein n=1 Tax=Mycobacterium phage Trixie TaxID=1071503 RepID=G1JV38_9CAUD|nr:hypothetical protein TRIXIE_80 [Mycobacterium phage Trixie]AEL17880.1 hypothetical protein TRIXIE_80 [Mycobacterium phage Trixie]
MTETREKRIPLSPQLATEQFKEVWGDGHLLCDISTKLTCIEFEALADMLLAIGVNPGTIEGFEECHAEGDECGDMHCQCDDPECIEERTKP